MYAQNEDGYFFHWTLLKFNFYSIARSACYCAIHTRFCFWNFIWCNLVYAYPLNERHQEHFRMNNDYYINTFRWNNNLMLLFSQKTNVFLGMKIWFYSILFTLLFSSFAWLFLCHFTVNVCNNQFFSKSQHSPKTFVSLTHSLTLSFDNNSVNVIMLVENNVCALTIDSQFNAYNNLCCSVFVLQLVNSPSHQFCSRRISHEIFLCNKRKTCIGKFGQIL